MKKIYVAAMLFSCLGSGLYAMEGGDEVFWNTFYANKYQELGDFLATHPAYVQGSRLGATPLIIAAASSNLTMVRLLLEHGATSTINHRSDAGSTALHEASSRAYSQAGRDVIRILLQYGANRDIQNKANKKPFDLAHAAGRYNLEEIAKLFFSDSEQKGAC